MNDTTSEKLQGSVNRPVVPGTTIYTDELTIYANRPRHNEGKHSVSESVRGRVHTNSSKSFWSKLKLAN